jgi:hypothetical protein
MRSIMMLAAVLALASLAGCVYYEPRPAHYETYSYAAPTYYYPPPPPSGGAVVVYDNSAGWSDDGWPPNGRYRSW